MDDMRTAAILLSAVALITASFRKMGWNPVLGLIAAGVALGPHGFKFVAPGGSLAHMAELGVLFLLFVIGVELSAERIKTMARYIFGLGASHFAISALLLGGFALVTGEGAIAAIVIGIALAMSSTAFVLQTLSDTKQMSGAAGRKSFSVLLFQDLMVAPILAVVPLLASMAEPGAAQQAGHSAIPLHVAAIIMVVIFVVARLVLQQLIGFIHEDENDPSKSSHERSSYFLAAVVATALSMGVAAHHLGLSASLGAFLAGLALSGSEWRHDVKKTVQPLESTFLGIFFIALGAQVPLSATPVEMLLMAAAAVVIIVLKVGAGFLAALVNGIDKRRGFRIGLILAQAGEFSFIVLASAGAAAMPPTSADFWSGAAVLSLVVTPVLVSCAGRLRSEPKGAAADTVPGAPSPEPVSEPIAVGDGAR